MRYLWIILNQNLGAIMKKAMLLLAIMLLPCQSAFGEYSNLNPPPWVLSFAFNGRVFSPAAQFGNLLVFDVREGDIVHLRFGNRTAIDVDLHAITLQAAAMWDRRLATAQVPVHVRPAENPNQVNFEVRVATEAQAPELRGDGARGMPSPALSH